MCSCLWLDLYVVLVYIITKKKKIVSEIYPTFLESVMTILLQTGTKLPFALFGQINQHFALLPKLNREMPSFENRVFQNRVKPYSDVTIGH